MKKIKKKERKDKCLFLYSGFIWVTVLLLLGFGWLVGFGVGVFCMFLLLVGFGLVWGFFLNKNKSSFLVDAMMI